MNLKKNDYVRVKRDIWRFTEVDGLCKKSLYVKEGEHGIIVEVFRREPTKHTYKSRTWYAKVQIDGVVRTLRLTSLIKH